MWVVVVSLRPLSSSWLFLSDTTTVYLIDFGVNCGTGLVAQYIHCYTSNTTVIGSINPERAEVDHLECVGKRVGWAVQGGERRDGELSSWKGPKLFCTWFSAVQVEVLTE